MIFNPFVYRRRPTRVVEVGAVAVGGENPIRVQSMTTTPTLETQAIIEQVIRLVEAGCEIVRITAPTVKEAAQLEKIKLGLEKRGLDVPLVADIHFRPDAACLAADFVEKVRINPGNFADSKAFRLKEYTDEEYQSELRRLEETFAPLVLKLKKLGRALRIGTNHGSLSDRIMNRYGDTPQGMVESALEYVRVCEQYDFRNVILSLKSSNPRVMIAANRLLVEKMGEEGMDYPIHLGVTEAGGGEDGRLKSAVGIGSLLEDGIGDTIRVSLTEDPEREIPVAKDLADRYAPSRAARWAPPETFPLPKEQGIWGPFGRRETPFLLSGPIEVGGKAPIRVVSRVSDSSRTPNRIPVDTPPEILILRSEAKDLISMNDRKNLSLWVSISTASPPTEPDFDGDGIVYSLPTNDFNGLAAFCLEKKLPLILRFENSNLDTQTLGRIGNLKGKAMVWLDFSCTSGSVHSYRRAIALLKEGGFEGPLVLGSRDEKPTLSTAIVIGSLLCDGYGDAVSVSSGGLTADRLAFAYDVLQACGARITRAEYVACPSCGRTMFDIQKTTLQIMAKTRHLKGVKIAVMGCIVNGPGEMADADFGYVGGGPGEINLFVGKACVERSIPEAGAVDKLIHLIKTYGRWVEP
ncbi:MAG: (E)-4-hydroxy-3-methylbut-2-enyl-diphosphate synthase [Elusimicrobia bacterium]|nr:(E)-4-hydroxy-3-methylbut-2-enyl-diphosphate synthase [Candidatus Obscuribacterium magneticum]